MMQHVLVNLVKFKTDFLENCLYHYTGDTLDAPFGQPLLLRLPQIISLVFFSKGGGLYLSERVKRRSIYHRLIPVFTYDRKK